MKKEFKHIELKLVSPLFDSKLLDTLMELNHLRRLRLWGTTKPVIFFQLKEIFHLLESVGSARIEGNRTTVSEYIEQKLEKSKKGKHIERFTEISNIEQAMIYIEDNIDLNADISHHFIRELHQTTVGDLLEEGDQTPGAYRTWQVEIVNSTHLPPEPHLVDWYMDELVEFINQKDNAKYDLIKIALAHHRFVWIHPFGNGNDRVVRLLTYTLLIKYGFRVKHGQLINPTAVFCNDREKYYDMLSQADQGTETKALVWCEYVLTGICEEISKVNKLLDHKYLFKNVLKPAIALSKERRVINNVEAIILTMGLEKQTFSSSDISRLLPDLTSRQRAHLVANLKTNNLIKPLTPNGRKYFVAFDNNYLMRSLIQLLESENFIPPIDE